MGLKEIIRINEITEQKGNLIWRCIVAEFIGNFLLNFFGIGAAVFNLEHTQTLISLNVTFIVFVLVHTLIHISGHINPAISIALFACGHVGLIKMLLFILTQCLGAIAGTLTLMILAPQRYSGNYGATIIAEGFSVWKGLTIEILLGFLAMFVIMGYIDKDRTDSKPIGIFAIAAVFGIGHFHSLNVTGSSFNPARSLGSAVVGNEWKDHWVYWLGPIAGCVLGGLTYRWIIQAELLHKGEEEGTEK